MPLLRPNAGLSELFPDLPSTTLMEIQALQDELNQESNCDSEGNQNTFTDVEPLNESPFLLGQRPDMIDSEIITEALKAGGIAEAKLNLPISNDNPFKKVLNHNGASVENASRVIAHVMMNGKYEHSKLKAAEMVLDMHGIRDMDGKVKTLPTFQFVIKDSSVNMQNIFAPIRQNADNSD